MWGYGFGDGCSVGYLLYDALDGSFGKSQRICKGIVVLKERTYSVGHGQDSSFSFLSVRPALAVDNKASLLPLDIVLCEPCKLGDSKSRIKQGEDDEFFLEGLSGVYQSVRFLVGKWFSFVLVGGHWLDYTMSPFSEESDTMSLSVDNEGR